MSDWISARKASKRMTDAGLTEGDLIEWARLGKLRARAESGIFSSDDAGPDGFRETRRFLSTPPSSEIGLSTLGPWPDILADFWKEAPIKQSWGPGTFKARITYWEDHYQRNDCEIIELFGVMFNKEDLETLLKEPPASPESAQEPTLNWQKKGVTQRQASAMKFLETMEKYPPKQPLGASELYREYLRWHADPKNKQHEQPLVRSAFRTCADRFHDGWRVAAKRWVHGS